LKTGHTTIMVVLLAVSIAGATVLAQQKPEYDMGKMQMLFLDQSPEWKSGDHADEIRKEHRAYVEGLITNGKLALWGEVASEGGLREIGVVKTESIEEARAMTQLFPAVKAGMLKAEVLRASFPSRALFCASLVPARRAYSSIEKTVRLVNSSAYRSISVCSAAGSICVDAEEPGITESTAFPGRPRMLSMRPHPERKAERMTPIAPGRIRVRFIEGIITAAEA